MNFLRYCSNTFRMKHVHIFDVDHTIISSSSGGFFAKRCIKEGVFSLKVLYRLPLYYLYYRFSALKPHQMDNGLEEFKGTPRAAFEAIARAVFNEEMKDAIYPNMEQLIRRLLGDGHRVLIATSSADFIVAPLAEYLGITEMVTTTLEFDDRGICTGRFEKGFALGEGKLKKVETYLAGQGTGLDTCVFYSDSYHDLPLLSKVGLAVPVNPDIRLKRAAKKNGWRPLKAGTDSLPFDTLVPA